MTTNPFEPSPVLPECPKIEEIQAKAIRQKIYQQVEARKMWGVEQVEGANVRTYSLPDQEYLSTYIAMLASGARAGNGVSYKVGRSCELHSKAI